MIEIGCFWALWSLIFKNEYKSGKNVLIELSKRALDVGITNFKLNNFECIPYHGGIFIEDSGTFKNKEFDILYPKNPEHYFNENIRGELVGNELNFNDIINQNNINYIDLLHMDIQGSELKTIIYFIKNNFINKIENLIVCTHSISIHEEIKRLLLNTHKLHVDIPFGGMGGDGYLYFKIL